MPGESPFASPMEIHSHLAKLQAAETCHLSSAFPQPSLLLAGCQDTGCSLSTDRYRPRAQQIKQLPPIPVGVPPGLRRDVLGWGDLPQISQEVGVSMHIFQVLGFGDPRGYLHSGRGQKPLVLQLLNIPFDDSFANLDLN